MDVEKLMNETSIHYERKMDNLFYRIQQLKNRCITLTNENKALRKQNSELLREKKKTTHYRNGQKRGKHGRHG